MTPTNDKVDQSGADGRAKFEAWYAEKYQGDASTFTRFDFGIMEYRCAYIQQSWLAWSARAALQAQPSATANPNVIQDRNAHNDLLTYVLQDDVHNRLIPRVIDIAYTAFMCAKQPNNEDGGTSDWFNDTKPVITKAIDKLRKDLLAATPANMPASDAEFLSIDDYALWSKFVGLRELQIEDVPLPDLIPRIRAILAPQQPVAASYPECSGDSSSCPENEGHGCCKPNPVQAKALTDEREAFEAAYAKLCCVPDTPDEDLMIWAKQTARFELTTGMNWRHSRDEIGEYRDSTVQRSWEIWQARALLASQPSATNKEEKTMNTELKNALKSFLDRLIDHSQTGVIPAELYEGDADTLRDAISYIDLNERSKASAQQQKDKD